MLSRIAESLFWIGRYLERSDGTARILDVHVQLLLEDPWADEDTACRFLLSVMGSPLPPISETVGRDDVLWRLAVDRDEPASIAYSLAAARENGRHARSVLSNELWECLNAVARKLPRRLRTDSVHGFFQWAREHAALAVGIVEASTRRDEAWQFFRLGRSIERADMTARLVSMRAPDGGAGPSWTTILRSCGAYETFLRTYGGMPSVTKAPEFLLLDGLFPRSVVYSISQAEEAVNAIDPFAERVPRHNQVQHALGRIRSELQYTPLAELMDNLAQTMDRVQVVMHEASDAISGQFFPTRVEPSWIEKVS